MPDDRCCKVVCKAYMGLRSQLRLERKEMNYTVSSEVEMILGLLDEMVEDLCEGV